MNLSASLAQLIDRLDDWVNPIVVKELRQAVKSRVITSIILLFLAILLLVVGVVISVQVSTPQGTDGKSLFSVLQAILLGTCMILIPSYAATRMAGERSDSNVDLLFISTLRPTSIIAGKFFSAMILAMLIFSCCAPFMTFTYLMRGIDIPSILVVFFIDLLAIIAATMYALFLISLPLPTAFKNVLIFFSCLQVFYAYVLLVIGTSVMINQGIFFGPVLTSEFWLVLGLGSLATLLGSGLLFCWAVAMISPPSANRALTGRIFMATSVLLLGLGCLIPVLQNKVWGTPLTVENQAILTAWAFGSVLLFCLNLVISVNERETWGPRITRTIPRWGLFRLIAFLFYSGAAGGVLFSVIGILVTILIWSATLDQVFSGMGLPPHSVQMLIATALFTYCYCMTALLVRRFLFSRFFRRDQTWVVIIIVVAIGCVLPWLLAMLIDSRHMYNQERPWWIVINPFFAIPFMETGNGKIFTDECLMVLSGWAVLITLLATPWFFQQFRLFRRPAAPTSAPPAEHGVVETSGQLATGDLR